MKFFHLMIAVLIINGLIATFSATGYAQAYGVYIGYNSKFQAAMQSGAFNYSNGFNPNTELSNPQYFIFGDILGGSVVYFWWMIEAVAGIPLVIAALGVPASIAGVIDVVIAAIFAASLIEIATGRQITN